MLNDRSFLWTVLGLALALVGVAVLGTVGVIESRGAAVATGVVLAVLGLVFVRWPYTTAATVDGFGPRRAAQVARSLGLITILLGVAIALAGCAPAGMRGAGAAASPLRVMSFNIRYGTADDGPNAWPLRRELVHATVERADADILGVQEALRFQLDELLARAPGYQRVGVGRDDGVNAGEFSAILYRTSRLAVAEQGTFWLSDTPDAPGSMHWGNRITRIATWARFRDRQSGDSLLVLNTHWDHESQPSRERSAALIRGWLAEHAANLPVLVMGDFNAGEQNPAFRALVADTGSPPHLRDTWRDRHPYGPEQGTFHGFRGGADSEKIDAILVSAEWRVLEAAIDSAGSAGRYPSDHHPVTATVIRGDG